MTEKRIIRPRLQVPPQELITDLPPQLVEQITAERPDNIATAISRASRHPRAGMTRRETLAWMAAGGAALALGTLHLANTLKPDPIGDLEAHARKTLERCKFINDSLTEEDPDQYECYEQFFKLTIGQDFTFEAFLAQMYKQNFQGEKKLIGADVGGGSGCAAAKLNRIPGVEMFVIDPFPYTHNWEGGLPDDRFIATEIENTGLPDNSFHFMMSFDALHFTDIPVAVSEIHRLLKPGGAAICDIHQWYDPENLEKMKAIPIPENVNVTTLAKLKGVDTFPLPLFLELAEFQRKLVEPGMFPGLLEASAFVIFKETEGEK
ncbi:MAG: class I SAM-dependent methyltransferase [Methanobacteriota archaeon]